MYKRFLIKSMDIWEILGTIDKSVGFIWVNMQDNSKCS